MFYERKIKYSDYLEEGERVRGAGFVKIEARENTVNLSGQISGLPENLSGEKEIILEDNQKQARLATFFLTAGKGSFHIRGLSAENLGGTGISHAGLLGVRIPLEGRREVYCVWRPREAWKGTADAEKPEPVPEAAPIVCKGLPESAPEAASEEGESLAASMKEDAQPAENTERISSPQPAPMEETKWKQLSAIYPHIRPFRDEREYISIGPADFVLLPERYYRMVNNSFLLHGYYNYEHLILTRTEKRGVPSYYIGVPGNYYEREKQVAVMFGFESFECMEEPAKQGDFGYYMMRLEL